MIQRFISIIILLMCYTAGQATIYSFGGDTTGVAEWQITNETVATQNATSPANSGTLDSGIVWIDDNFQGPFTVVLVIYEVVGADSSLVDSSAQFTVNNASTPTKYSAAFQLDGTIDASTVYLIGWLHYGGSGNIKILYTDDNAVDWNWDAGNTSVPNVFHSDGFTGSGRDNYALWIYYSDVEPTVSGRRRRILGGGQ